MKNIFSKIRKENGTALIVAMLIMGVLIAISLALASLIFGEVKITRELIDSGKAYYSAESGIEESLYYLSTELPGWEPSNNQWVGLKVNGGSTIDPNDLGSARSKFRYEVKNTCTSYPCIDDMDTSGVGTDILDMQSAFYDVLPLNQSITIPMFVVKTGNVEAIKDFVVEYYAAFDTSDLRFFTPLSGWDILRWKIFGMKKYGTEYVTESISDFVPVTSISSGVGTNASSPSWFGTSAAACTSSVGASGINCLNYSGGWFASQKNPSLACTNMEARDYYSYTPGINKEYITTEPCHGIDTFVTDHLPGPPENTGLNYLTLTNIMNPAMFDNSKSATGNLNLQEREKKSDLYFRVEVGKDASGAQQKIVREYADITSDGTSGNASQSINVKLRRNSYMPVFNFSIYSTYGKEMYYNDYSVSVP